MDGQQVFGGAIPDSEGFEHNDLTGQYVGDTGAFSIQTGTVDEGTYALFGNNNGSFAHIVRDADSTWNRYGLRISYREYIPSGTGGSGGLAVAASKSGKSNFDGYGFYPNDQDGYIRLDKWDGGTVVDNQKTSTSPTADSWVTGTVDFLQDGTIDWTFDGINVSLSDQTWEDLYLAFHTYRDGYADDVQFSTI
jgi:hypothetical protein